ncbi:hypothetical protein K469DRAFT_694062 [Zopfia rhizophila CBS 207.26]|uniref:Beta-lactamase-related domain-containing protein n=1 Tax=Zopfia rhizophila CBS 207.26 TaxID=1314779 RepID=A0A6A6DMA3_9PEZI|nr:hypothetical protein K469DRAFT_694062 [Zopfia rhizophila CBS 207.26]
MASKGWNMTKLDLPSLNKPEVPTCGLNSDDRPRYTLLGLVLEKTTSQTYSDAMQSALWEPLILKRTSVDAPINDSNIVILVVLMGVVSELMPELKLRAGYTTLSEMNILGLSILQSTLLTQSLTRRWLKPWSMNSDPLAAVGAPREIVRMNMPVAPNSNETCLVNLYTKGGDLGSYSALLVLDKDHNIGISILVAGKSGTPRTILGSLLTETWIPALQAAACEESKLHSDGPGLKIDQFITNGVDFHDWLDKKGDSRLLPCGSIQWASNLGTD